MKSTRQRASEALRSDDFRRLFAIRLITQSGDGLFQAALVASIVFNPEEQNTILGFAIATLVVSLPFSILGPFTGVFIDRWSRRKILVVAPWLRAAAVWLVLFDPKTAPVLFFGGALWVLSVNRFYLATAQAVVPRMVLTEDLLMANSMATVGGTVARPADRCVRRRVDRRPLRKPAGDRVRRGRVDRRVVGATRIRARSSPTTCPRPPCATSRRVARGSPMASRCWRERRGLSARSRRSRWTRWDRGSCSCSRCSCSAIGSRRVGSFANLIGAGGVGVLLGILTVGKLEERLPKERIVALAFFAGGLVLIAVASYVTGWSVLIASFAIGLTFAWKKIPVDTMVQEAIPDGYRGRVFAVYDVAYNLSRVAAAFLAIPLLNAFGEAWAVAIVGVVFILWSPILPRWIGRIPSSRSGSTRAPAPRRTLGPSSGAGSRRPSRSSAARWRIPTACDGRAIA